MINRYIVWSGILARSNVHVDECCDCKRDRDGDGDMERDFRCRVSWRLQKSIDAYVFLILYLSGCWTWSEQLDHCGSRHAVFMLENLLVFDLLHDSLLRSWHRNSNIGNFDRTGRFWRVRCISGPITAKTRAILLRYFRFGCDAFVWDIAWHQCSGLVRMFHWKVWFLQSRHRM